MKKTMQDIMQEFCNAPTATREIEVTGQKYIVVSHYGGTKDLDKVLYELAKHRAYAETAKAS